MNPSHATGGAQKVSRRRVLQAAVCGAAAAALTSCAPRSATQVQDRTTKRPDRPNILVLLTDQQHAGMLSCTGNPHLRTPAMDELAAGGVRWECAYASDPICIPARTSLMTGRYPSHFGFNGNTGAKDARFAPPDLANTLGRLVRQGGYETVYGGKTHWPAPLNVQAVGFEDFCRDQRDQLAEQAAAWLNQKHERPFFMVASFINPHDICYLAIDAFTSANGQSLRFPKSETERRTLAEALRIPDGLTRQQFLEKLCPPLPANFEIPQGEPEGAAAVSDFTCWVRRNWSADDWRMHRWAYARLTEVVDRQIGTVLAGLRRAGLEKDTLVILTSDHGDMDAAHRLEHKSVFYEESVRVPMLVRGPGVAAGRVDRSSLVSSSLDLLPTVCHYAGVTPPSDLPGRSLHPLLEGQAQNWRDHLVVESSLGRMVRTPRYKYAVYPIGQQREQLIDLATDPGEMNNLAGTPDAAAVLADHRRRLRRDIEVRGDKLGRPYLSATS